jgi:hypothetical protein
VRTVGNSENAESSDKVILRGKLEWIRKELSVGSLQLLVATRTFFKLYGVHTFSLLL